MTMGTLIHHVLESVFPEGEPVPEVETVERRVPAALQDAIRQNAIWLDSPGWATECASLMNEARMTALAWGRFLREADAQPLSNEVELSGSHRGLPLAGRADCLLRLPDGHVLVVDHKRSGSAARRDRMANGWDLQVALYRAMLEGPSDALPSAVAEQASEKITAYHTTLDGTVLVDETGTGIPGAECIGGDISAKALAELARLVAQIGGGTIELNRLDDEKRFKKERGITAYALKGNEFVNAFLMSASEDELDA